MGVLNRLIDMTRAAANELIDKLEDPAMMLNHYVRKAQEEIETVAAEQLKQEAMAKSYGQQAAEFMKMSQLCEDKALTAMTAGDEAAAREALSLKLGYADKARELASWQLAAAERSSQLEQQLEAAKAELAAMQKKRDELVARMERTEAKARVSMPSFCGGIDTGSAARGFQRMEEKIAQREAHAELHRRSYGTGSAAGFGGVYGAADPAATADPSHEALINEQLEQLRKRTAPEQQ